MSADLARVRAVIVSWNSEGLVGRAVASVPAPARVVVVDNASADGSAAVAERGRGGRPAARRERRLRPRLQPRRRRGRRASAGRTRSSSSTPTPPSSTARPRSRPSSPSSTPTPRRARPRPPSRATGRSRSSSAGSRRSARSRGRRSSSTGSSRGTAGSCSERYLDRGPRASRSTSSSPPPPRSSCGASVFERVGGFDPAFAPAWFEDVDLCARILESGYRIRFVPAARASHVGGTTMRALPYDDYLPLYTRNLLRYLAPARRRPPAGRGPGRRPAAGALLRLALLPFVRGDHARPEAASAYVRVLAGLVGFGFTSALLPRRALSAARRRLPRHAQRVPRRRAAPADASSRRRSATSSSSPSTTAPRTAPAPPSPPRRRSRRSRWTIVASRENLGFTGGHNVGIGTARSSGAPSGSSS